MLIVQLDTWAILASIVLKITIIIIINLFIYLAATVSSVARAVWGGGGGGRREGGRGEAPIWTRRSGVCNQYAGQRVGRYVSYSELGKGHSVFVLATQERYC